MFQRILLYSKLPEMRLFWFFLPLILVIFGIEIFYLPVFFLWISAGFFIVLAAIILVNNLRLARSNLEIKIERNELSGIIVALRDGIIAYDSDFKILLFNKAAESIFNLAAANVLGRRLSPEQIREPHFNLLIYVLFPSLAPVVIKRSEVGAEPQIIDLSFDEPRKELRVITNKIIDPNGALLGFVKVVSDRTREKEMLRSKNEFIATAAHQLRTPLTGINWALETLVAESLPENQKQIVKSGLQTSAFLLKIVNDLLDVSKIEEGRFGYDFEKTNFIDFAEKIILEAEKIADEIGVKIYFQKPVEPVEINIDSQKLGIALYNLLDNAIRYNVKNGEVIVSVEKLRDKPYIQVSVKDTGIGIPREDIENIFVKFFRADNAVKSAPNGSGLGLYIVRNIIKRHGGEIRVESELNRGSVFYFTLPIDPELIPPKETAYDE